MTTDIKELPLLVSKAKASLFTLEYISQFEPADIDADNVDLRFEVDGRETGTNVSIVDECGQAAEIIMALIEALEAKGARIAELEKCLSNLAAVSRRYLPDYDEHPEIQAAEDLLEQNSLVAAGGIQIHGGE
ncbi:hypothetical protein ABW09_12055 [Pluralibacter gergoviae]|uniref:hypothetical protein n=1 Tax=Pluralibacter gergoviae TaxID=61647 RepID=UPI00065047F2|nr:hypothetical protein [Pluralibacter gergoviae]KMK17774.1 hypothetical protein ABW09_12055 [Pluralibacter gergoviae]